MKKRIQLLLSDESWSAVEKITKEANRGFENGHITYSDVLNEMALNSCVDIGKLQTKHTNVRKSLRLLASQDNIDLDEMIKNLQNLKKLQGPQRSTNKSKKGIDGSSNLPKSNTTQTSTTSL